MIQQLDLRNNRFDQSHCFSITSTYIQGTQSGTTDVHAVIHNSMRSYLTIGRCPEPCSFRLEFLDLFSSRWYALSESSALAFLASRSSGAGEAEAESSLATFLLPRFFCVRCKVSLIPIWRTKTDYAILFRFSSAQQTETHQYP